MAGVDLFEAFVKVVELGSFVKAADNLQITPAAMTKRINNLESSLGLRLLTRSTRQVGLTGNGEALFQQCLKIMQDLKDTADIVEQLKGEPSGRLRILASLDFGETFLLPHLADFMEQHTKIHSDLELSDRIPNLNQEDVDIIMGLTIEEMPNWHQDHLLDTRKITCASPSFLKKFKTPRTPEELTQYPVILHKHQHATNHLVFKKKISSPISPTLSFANTRSVCMAVMNNLGVAQLSDYIINRHLNSGALVEILEDYKTEAAPLYCYYKKETLSFKKTRLFIEFIKNRIPLSTLHS